MSIDPVTALLAAGAGYVLGKALALYSDSQNKITVGDFVEWQQDKCGIVTKVDGKRVKVFPKLGIKEEWVDRSIMRLRGQYGRPTTIMPGDHISWLRKPAACSSYCHQAIVSQVKAGELRVVHQIGPGNPIKEEWVPQGDARIVFHCVTLTLYDVWMKRARSRVGENKYDLLFNNCIQFANWCRRIDMLYAFRLIDFHHLLER